MSTIPGLGAALPVTDLAAVFTQILDELPGLVDRNDVGNLAVVTPADGGWEAVGWIDVFGGDGICYYGGEEASR